MSAIHISFHEPVKEIHERKGVLEKLECIKKAILFFSPKSGDMLSEHGMIHILWVQNRRSGLKKYLNGLADTLEKDIGGSDANRS